MLVLFPLIFLRILMVLDKTIHKAFRIHKTLQTKPIRDFFFLHNLPKLYIGFNVEQNIYTVHVDIYCFF